ncbi:MAG: hypothetical protein ACKO1M_04800, partial [Planctomycetota bacterium]
MNRATPSGFPAVLLVRILTVLTDNLARWLVIGLGKRAAVAVGATEAAVLAAGTIFYVLPFILFAWLAGWLADRFPKRAVVIAGKFAEIVIAVITAGIVAWGASSGIVPSRLGFRSVVWIANSAMAPNSSQSPSGSPPITTPDEAPQATI